MISDSDHGDPRTFTGSIIDEPGTYIFDDDRSTVGDGIEITASDVTIDGRGHQLVGDGQRAGIHVRDGNRDVSVWNLTVRNFRRGVDVRRGSSLALSSVTVEGNAADGVRSDSKAEVACKGSTVRRNGGSGIDIHDGRVSIRDCVIRENTKRALRSGARATAVIEDSVVAENGGAVSIPATAGSRVERTLIEANGGPGIETAAVNRSLFEATAEQRLWTSLVDRSPIKANGGPETERAPVDGQSLDEPALVRHCNVRDNAGPGVEHTNGFLEVRRCTLTGNKAGYRVQTRDEFEAVLRNNVIEDNEEGGAIVDPTSFPKPISATCNWWGDETGPRHRDNPLEDPSGQSVTDRVQFLPWSTDRANVSADREGTDGPCIGGLDDDESAVGYLAKKSHRQITGSEPYDANCWDGTFYITDSSDVDRNGFDGPGTIRVGEDERLADGYIIRAEADEVPVTLPTWGGERGDCESVLFVELNRRLSVDRAYRIADVHDPLPYQENVDTGGFARTLDGVIRVTFEPVDSDGSADGSQLLR
ncbi:right-handed parallel beta-helix repeat-containing protein [Halorubrum sp. N11]|uniref:right-handed parallel beta-helix repeat-containing protein n=1 Tax=Halorubrum sp. N11 TaxID=3402276 RepID=UPI003EBC3C05